MERLSRIRLQVAHIVLQTDESVRLLPGRVGGIEDGIGLLEDIARRLSGLGRLEAAERSVRVLSYWCTARVVTACTLILGGSWSEGMEVLRSGLESLAQQHLFVSNEEELDAWFGGRRIDSRTLLKAVEEEGFGKFWAALGKYAHPTLQAVAAYARQEDDVWVFDPARTVTENDLTVALDAAAAVLERQIQVIVRTFGARLSPTLEDTKAFQERFERFRAGMLTTDMGT